MRCTTLALLVMATLAIGQNTTPEPYEEEIHPLTKAEALLLITDNEGSLAVRYFKHLLSILDTKQAPQDIANEVHNDFLANNADGKLGADLRSLFEIRLEDLLISVRHYRKMRQVLELLLGEGSV